MRPSATRALPLRLVDERARGVPVELVEVLDAVPLLRQALEVGKSELVPGAEGDEEADLLRARGPAAVAAAVPAGSGTELGPLPGRLKMPEAD